ncbi:hypothetical protein Tco_0415593 [Tanacetum coccineum]
MSNRLEEIIPGFVSQLTYNIASQLRGNGVNGLGPRLMFNISGVVANGVMGDGGSVSVAEGVGNGVMVGENIGNGVTESVQEVLGNGAKVNGVVMNNGDAGARSFYLGGAPTGSIPRVDRDRLLRNFNQEIREDIARLSMPDKIRFGAIAVRKGRKELVRTYEREDGTKIGEKARFYNLVIWLIWVETNHFRVGSMVTKGVGKSNEVMNHSEEVGCSEGPAYRTVLETTTGLYPVSNKALLTFLVVVSELVVGINGVSEETPSVRPIDAAVDAGTPYFFTKSVQLLPVNTSAFGVKKVTKAVADWSVSNALKMYMLF